MKNSSVKVMNSGVRPNGIVLQEQHVTSERVARQFIVRPDFDGVEFTMILGPQTYTVSIPAVAADHLADCIKMALPKVEAA